MLSAFIALLQWIASNDSCSNAFDRDAVYAKIATALPRIKELAGDTVLRFLQPILDGPRMSFADVGSYLRYIATWLQNRGAELSRWVYRHRKAIFRALLIIAIVVLSVSSQNLIVYVIQAIGFSAPGVAAGSAAAAFQAAHLGAFIAKGSLFAVLQSIGALGCLPVLTSALITVTGLAVAAVVAFKAFWPWRVEG